MLGMLDVDIREALRHAIRAVHGRDPDTVVVDELGVLQGSARVDVAVVNGLLHGYEIKSERDSLARLPSQVSYYSKVFDLVTLVLSQRHLSQAMAMIPHWWGVTVAVPSKSGRVKLISRRKSSINPSVSARDLAELLWSDDVIRLLDARNAARGLRGKNRHILWDKLCDVYSIDELRSEVRSRIKARVRARAHRAPSPLPPDGREPHLRKHRSKQEARSGCGHGHRS